MRLKTRHFYFLAFTAIFAVLAGFVFWGTWGLSVCPVMPDARMTFPEQGYVASVLREWIKNGKFVPWDITAFLGSPYLWQEMQYALAVYFSALALAYYLKGRGLSLLSCYGAGLFLGFCGYWLTLFSAGHAGWFRLLMVAVFAFGLADRAVRKGKAKNYILLGATVAWGGFYQPDIWLLFTVFTAAYFIWCCIREKKIPSIKGMVLSALVFAVIAAPSIKGAAKEKAGRDEQIEQSKGSALSGGQKADDKEARWVFVTNWSLPPNETVEFFIPRINGDTSCATVLSLGRRVNTGVKPYTGALGRPLGAKEGNYRQHSLYVGFVTCLFALASVVLFFVNRGREKEIAFFALSAVFFYLLSMGRNFEVLYRLVFALPIGDSIRAPVKWHHLTELCLCVLAGFGIEAVRKHLVSLGAKQKTVGIVLGIVILVGAIDLARCAKLYCAPLDLSIVKSANPAAELIKKRGGGRVADFLQGGRGPVSWSFGAKGVGMTADYASPNIRFIWAPAQLLNTPDMRNWLKSKGAVPAGAYYVTERAVRDAAGSNANVMLMEIPSVPAPEKKPAPLPPITVVTYLGAFSLLGTLFALVYGAKKS